MLHNYVSHLWNVYSILIDDLAIALITHILVDCDYSYFDASSYIVAIKENQPTMKTLWFWVTLEDYKFLEQM